MDVRVVSIVARWRMPLVFVAAALVLLAGASYCPASAKAPSDLQAVREQIAALRGEIEALRTMLQQAMGPRPASATGAGAVPSGAIKPLTIGGRPSKGSPKA